MPELPEQPHSPALVADQDGVEVDAGWSGPVDVLLDGRRIWSFEVGRDAAAVGGGRLKVPWPPRLRPYLVGRAALALVRYADRSELRAGEVRFTDDDTEMRLEDAAGHPLAVDKNGRLHQDFSATDAGSRAEIMDAVERVVADLVSCGIEPYLMYGCLLGAVRDGHMIGHDTDVDLAWLSACTHPFDIIRETSRVVRRMRELGWSVVSLSAANFKVTVPLAEGRTCGVDVFGSFYVSGVFHVMGALAGDLDRSALVPFGTVVLEGREIVAPARPEEVLAFTYGETWRVPDPSFHFHHPPENIRRLDGWFRSTRRRFRYWNDFYRGPDGKRVPTEPSLFAQWVADRLEEPTRVLDVGAGNARDSTYLAAQGHTVTAMDFVTAAFPQTRPLRRRQGVKVTERNLNLENLHRVLVVGREYAHRPETHTIYARGLLDALWPTGRENLWRFASMTQRRGGETFLEFRTPRSRSEATFFPRHRRTFLDPAVAEREIASFGGRVVHREEGRGRAPLGQEDPYMCRLVVRWS